MSKNAPACLEVTLVDLVQMGVEPVLRFLSFAVDFQNDFFEGVGSFISTRCICWAASWGATEHILPFVMKGHTCEEGFKE